MSVQQLISDLTNLEIRLEAHGDQLRYFPRSSVTPAMTERLKQNKSMLLAILRSVAQQDMDALKGTLLAGLADDPDFSDHVIEGLQAATMEWIQTKALDSPRIDASEDQ